MAMGEGASTRMTCGEEGEVAALACGMGRNSVSTKHSVCGGALAESVSESRATHPHSSVSPLKVCGGGIKSKASLFEKSDEKRITLA